MNDSEELAEKYHKLFQDYTRIKAQHAVLKKAVLKEQTDNAAIQAALKEKEQEVRKSLQDLDLLTFHNQRLTKRIENLQNQASTKSGGSWLVGGATVKKELEKSQSSLEAATIDLQAKIEENEKLHQQLYEINALYPRHVTELQGKIQTLEKQNQDLQLDVERAGVANEDTITLIRKEKDATEKELGMIRDVLAGQLQDEQRANQSLMDNVQRLEKEIERLSKIEMDMESLQSEHTKLQGELETLKWISSELSQLQEAYSSLERDRAQIEKAHVQLSQQYGALRQTEENVRRALAQEQETSRSAREMNKQLHRDLEAVRGEAINRERGHVDRIGQLESELEKVRKEQGKLQVQYEELKIAEKTAKEGESRTKADLAKDLAGMKSSLEGTEKKELEGLKETLEKELADVRTELEETKANLAAEKERKHTAVAETEPEHAEHEGKTEPEDEHGTEEESAEKEKAPLSKKARKKKAAAAAAAAATAAATGAVVTAGTSASDAKEDASHKGDDTKDDRKGKDIQDTKSREEEAAEKEKAKADSEAQEQKRKEEEEARKAVEDSLKAEIEALQQQIKDSQQSSESKQEELRVAQVALENVKDEKTSLSNSLEMHVELTLQLQQEIDSLKADLAKQQKYHGANGAAAGKRSEDGDDEPLVRTRHKSAQGTKGSKDGDQTPQRASTPVPTAGEEDRAKSANVAKDGSTQVDKVEALDKAVQSESVEQVDESTQADLVKEAAAVVAVAASLETDESKDGAKEGTEVDKNATNASIAGGRSVNNKSSRGSMIVDDSSATSTTATTTNQSNQSNREYLIKKHYETKIQHITEQLQLSDGRYARLHKEFGLLKELLMETVQAKETIAKECSELKSRNMILDEELAAAKEDNRQQVETMTSFMKSLDQRR
ncbi:hypothetical protein BGX27_006072 [Mortierella sp. AM989]|nr:hypothetical protein BGX27_006072 [Mortierella sp. AM989]